MNIASLQQYRLQQKEIKHTVQLSTELTADSNTCNTDTVLKYYTTGKSTGLYGVVVQRYQGGKLIDKQSVGSLTHSLSEINRIVNILAKHTVMPSTLIDVLDELEIAAGDYQMGAELLANDLFAPEPQLEEVHMA